MGARVMYAAAAAWSGVFTAAVALARGFGSLIGLRMLLGLGEAPIMPANSKVVSQWFPPHERAFASSIFNSGTEAGSALSLPICTALIGLFGWQWSFACTGALGVLWAIGWFMMYRSPHEHRRVSEAEEAAEADGEKALRWRELLRYRMVWGMVLGYICRASVSYGFLGFAGGSVWSLPADVAPSPRNVASLAGLQNFGSQIGGILSPLAVGFMVSMSGGYVLPLLVIGAVTVLGAAIYAFMMKVEPLQVSRA
ncbi:MAG TPA: MFS transporter [Actinomadura sp.]|nr:MFS transporter [Actinomadura sp.]